MASEYSYQLTKSAAEDLDEAVDYMTNTLGNRMAAAAFINTVESTIEKICAFPQIGPEVKNDYISVSGIRKKAIGNFLLYYLPDDVKESITVLRIVYGKRDTGKNP